MLKRSKTMKILKHWKAALAMLLVVLTAVLLPVQVFGASNNGKYVSEVYVAYGKNADEAKKSILDRLENELIYVLIVSHCDVRPLAEKPESAKDADVAGLAFEVRHSSAKKCTRCWHYEDSVGTIAGHEDVCTRCVTNIDGTGEIRKFA